MRGCFVDGPGDDLRVYQAVSQRARDRLRLRQPQRSLRLHRRPRALRRARPEAASSPTTASSTWPRARCTEARYVRIEDGELYPCAGRRRPTARAPTSTRSRCSTGSREPDAPARGQGGGQPGPARLPPVHHRPGRAPPARPQRRHAPAGRGRGALHAASWPSPPGAGGCCCRRRATRRRCGTCPPPTLVATFFNNFLPSNIGGDVIRVRDSSRLTGSTTTSLAVVAIDRILGLRRALRPGRWSPSLAGAARTRGSWPAWCPRSRSSAWSSACSPTSSSGPAPRAG